MLRTRTRVRDKLRLPNDFDARQFGLRHHPRASMAQSSQVLGVVLIFRHGDRLQFYQDPTTYDASFTTITPLGNVCMFISSL